MSDVLADVLTGLNVAMALKDARIAELEAEVAELKSQAVVAGASSNHLLTQGEPK